MKALKAYFNKLGRNPYMIFKAVEKKCGQGKKNQIVNSVIAPQAKFQECVNTFSYNFLRKV